LDLASYRTEKAAATGARRLDVSQFENHRFIFLCGLHRSGTSPLFRILREHPDISGFQNTGVPEDEGQHLQTVFPTGNSHGGPGKFGFDQAAHLTEESKLITAANQDRLFREWSRYWDLNKPYLLEKSPPNLIRTRFFQAMFPQSFFIVIVRHPVAASLATSKWTSSSLDALIQHWLHCHRLFESDSQLLRRVHVLKYEDLIISTEQELQKLFEFLGLNPHGSSTLNRDGNDPYFQNWHQLQDEPKTRDFANKVKSKYEHELRAFGYSFSDCISPSANSRHSSLILEKN
jgi:hypothetical protein